MNVLDPTPEQRRIAYQFIAVCEFVVRGGISYVGSSAILDAVSNLSVSFLVYPILLIGVFFFTIHPFMRVSHRYEPDPKSYE